MAFEVGKGVEFREWMQDNRSLGNSILKLNIWKSPTRRMQIWNILCCQPYCLGLWSIKGCLPVCVSVCPSSDLSFTGLLSLLAAHSPSWLAIQTNWQVRQSDSQRVRQSESRTVRQSDHQTVRQLDSQTVRQSDSQPVRQSGRQSDNHTVRLSDS